MGDAVESFIYLLKHTELAVRGCVEVPLLQFDLTPNQFLMLVRLLHHDGMSAAELARAVGIRPQSIGEALAPLEAKSLIRRQESSRHRRILKISLTSAGRQLLARATRVGRQLEKELLSDLNAAELAALRSGLTKVLARAQQRETR
jgi:DNA-binding MarR family transcriptional regulator